MTTADFTEPYDMPAPSKRERPRAATIADLRVFEASILAAITYSGPSLAPPRDLDAEDTVAEACITGAMLNDDAAELSADDFFGDTGRIIFTIWASDERPAACDIKAWHDALIETGLRGAVAQELIRIRDDVPAARGTHLRRFIDRIRHAAALRRALRLMAYADANARSAPPDADNVAVVREALQKALEALTL